MSNFPEITVDTTGIKNAVQNINNIYFTGDRQATCVNFNAIRMKTMPILGQSRFLNADDKEKAAKLAKKMKSNGWLTPEDEQWCNEQGIVTQ